MTAQTGSILSSRRTTYGAIAVSAAFVMELTLVPLLLPVIQQQFGLSIGQLAWVFNSYGIAVALGVLLGGFLGDVFGTRSIFALGVLLFAAGCTLVASAGSYHLLISGRLLQGFGGGIFSPLIPVLLTTAVPDRPGRALIVWGSIAGYVAALAPLLYSGVLEAHSWNLAFILFALIALTALAIVPRTRFALDPSQHAGVRPSYARLLRSPPLVMMFVYIFCTYGSITYYLFRVPVWLTESSFDVASIGLILSALWLSFSVVSTGLRNAVDAPFIRVILIVAPVLIASGFVLAYHCGSVACLLLASMLMGSGLACSNAPSTQLVLRFAPRGMTAVAASLDITCARLGGVATVAILADTPLGLTALVVVTLLSVALASAWYAGRELVANP